MYYGRDGFRMINKGDVLSKWIVFVGESLLIYSYYGSRTFFSWFVLIEIDGVVELIGFCINYRR